jgi:2,4-dienoyl-CoA reductase-like NADH-dependent reductase (Old Yellow Enzyme family)
MARTGSLENRSRLLLDIVREVRRAVGPSFPIAVKLNSADFQARRETPNERPLVLLAIAATLLRGY